MNFQLQPPVWPALALVAVLAGCRADGGGPPRLDATSADLAHTDFAVGPGQALDPARNLLWSGSLKLAWDALDGPLGGPPTPREPHPAAALLAATPFDASDVDARAVTIHAGLASPALASAVARALERRGSPPDPDFQADLAAAPPGSIFAYAEIAKDLPFATKFEDLASATLPFHGAAEGEPPLVDVFGIGWFSMTEDRHKKLGEQLRYHENEDRSEFAVVLLPEGETDRVVLARVAPGASLGATWDHARALIESTTERTLFEGDRFVAPELDFNLDHRFTELEGLVLAAPGGGGAPLDVARQDLRLKLDEEGLVFKSRAYFGVASAAANQPRELVFDRPYLVAAMEVGADAPYFLAWIAHPELLIPAE